MHILPDFEALVLSDCAAVQKPVSLCVVFFFTTPPTHTSLALLRWPRNVLCVRLTVCQSTCVLRWRKELMMMMMMIHRVLCHPLFKLLSIPAGGAC